MVNCVLVRVLVIFIDWVNDVFVFMVNRVVVKSVFICNIFYFLIYELYNVGSFVGRWLCG